MAKPLLDKSNRNTEGDLTAWLVDLVNQVQWQCQEIDTLLSSAEVRSKQALALAKSFFADLSRVDGWMLSAENVLDQLSVEPLAVEEESERLAALHIASKALERELDGNRVILEQSSSTAAALAALIAPAEALVIDGKVQLTNERFQKLSKRIRNRSILLEDAVTDSADVNDRLHVLNDMLNQTRELAATVGVRFEAQGYDQSPSNIISENDPASSVPFARMQQPVSMRSDYLSSQINETKVILDNVELRLPALKELTSYIEERLSAPSSKLSSRVQRPSLVFTIEEEPPVDAITVGQSTMLNRAHCLQRDWLQIHTEVSQLLTNLVEAHRLASEEFWLPISNLQADITMLQHSMDALILRGASKPPLEQSTYVTRIKEFEDLRRHFGDVDKQVDSLRDVGEKILDLLISGKTKRDKEKGILKKEITSAIEEVSAAMRNIVTACNQHLVTAKEHFIIAQKLQNDLENFIDLLGKAEKEFESLEGVANNTDAILKQMKQLEEWSSTIPPRHEQLENLKWAASLLMSAAETTQAQNPLPPIVGDAESENTSTAEVQEMLTSASMRWSRLNDALNHRHHQLQTELMVLGDFDSALEVLIKWIKTTQAAIDAISVSRGDKRSLEFELASAKMIQTSAARQQPAVIRINQEAKTMNQGNVSAKVAQMNGSWEKLKQSILKKQVQVEEALREALDFYNQLNEIRRKFRWLEGKISLPATRLVGGLPDSAKQSLNRFLQLHDSIQNLGQEINNLRLSSAGLLTSAGKTRDCLVGHIDSLAHQQAQLATQSQERLAQVQSVVGRVIAFHNDLGDFIQWLTQTERQMIQAPDISFVFSSLQLQLPAQTALRREIASKCESSLAPLDSAIVVIGLHVLEQDVVLMKNLLASAHSRWEKLFQKSADRSRKFATAFKESQKLLLGWNDLTVWMKKQLDTCLQENGRWSVSPQPEVLLRELTQHREFQRELGARSATYDSVRRHIIKVKEKAPKEDFIELNRMLRELKYLWNAVCTNSLEKQKVLEEALLRSGQYKDAFVSLFEWITKIDSLLDNNQNKGCAGDTETVKQLEEAHRNLLTQLKAREASVTKLQTVASQLLTKCRREGSGDAAELIDSLVMQEQLAGLNARWTRVQLKAKGYSENLKLARKNAEEFQKSCRDVFDYCTGAEYTLRKLGALPEGDDPGFMDSTEPLSGEKSVITVATAVTSGMAAQEARVCNCLAQGNRIIAECKNNPEAAAKIRQWMNAVNSRWEEMLDWSQRREAKLEQLSKNQLERRLIVDSLMGWLNSVEVILRSDRMCVQPSIYAGSLSIEASSEISSSSSSRFDRGLTYPEIDTSQVELLLAELTQFETELQERHSQYEDVLKHARKIEVNRRSVSNKVKALEPTLVNQAQIYASEKMNKLCENWNRVVKLVKARRMTLEELLAHAKEVEKLAAFDFDNWRRRYLDWMNVKKARIIDLFHQYDLNRDGKLSRDEFVNAILESKFSTSRPELEVVASIVDANNDGYIDMKKFNTALRSAIPPKLQLLGLSKVEGSAIEHETRHQASLCTCRNTYRISKINGSMYKFGSSQKIRLVRILRSNVMVRVGGGWMPLTEFLVKNDPCRASFCASTESECKASNFQEDQTHLMKFHPRFRDGSSASFSCTDPACSGRLDTLSRSNPLHASMPSDTFLKSASPMYRINKNRLGAKSGRQVAVRSSFPLFASQRQVNSLDSSSQSSLSSSARSHAMIKGSRSLNTKSSQFRIKTIPPSSLSSSLDETRETGNDLSLALDRNIDDLNPTQGSMGFPSNATAKLRKSLDHLSSILELNEGENTRPLPVTQIKEIQ